MDLTNFKQDIDTRRACPVHKETIQEPIWKDNNHADVADRNQQRPC